mmetsp:Transcript_40250/g.82378  ORF Transcript_40250/g.82378 Transcript_40250/m.82378 type:complete len:211 (+) Transcript_40250:122-754(+)
MFFERVIRKTEGVSVFFGKKSVFFIKYEKINLNKESYSNHKNPCNKSQKINTEKFKIYLGIKRKKNEHRKKKNDFLIKPYPRIQIIRGVSRMGSSINKRIYGKKKKVFKCQNNMKQNKEPVMEIYKNTLRNLKGYMIKHENTEVQGFTIKTFDRRFIFLIPGDPVPLHFKYLKKGDVLKKKDEKGFPRNIGYFSSISFFCLLFSKILQIE